MLSKFGILIIYIISPFFISQTKFYPTIRNMEQFVELQGNPLNDKFTNLKSVKIIWDYTSKKIYFFNSKKYKYHYDFCNEVLNYNQEISLFNDESYNPTKKRRFLLGNLNYLESSGSWIIELAASDEMNAEMIELFYHKIENNVYFKNDLHFYLGTPRLINLHEKSNFKIPVVYSDFVFNNIQEQSIQKGKTIGILKKYDLLKKDNFSPNSNEIIIINSTPEILPRVKGIIITELQTPLSHLVLLAKNRNIPVYVIKNAWNNPNLEKLLGKKVEFQVLENKFSIKNSSLPFATEKKKEKIVLKKNIQFKEIINLNNEVPKNAQNFIGAKANNLAQIIKISKELNNFKTPEFALAIPFYFYHEHITNNQIHLEIEKLKSISLDSTNSQNIQLSIIRKKIKKSKINPNLILEIEKLLSIQTQFKNFKFRSSTNAEDIEGFNGAGLYDSKAVKLGDSIKTIEKAILDVWASLWYDRAYLEREIMNIDQESVTMGILINRSFTDEKANGVLISKNLYRKEYKGITVNVQKDEESVVDPKKGIVCDEFYAHNFNQLSDKIIVDYRSMSSLNNNIPILNQKEIEKIFRISLKIEKKINSFWLKNNITKKYRPIDIEFKIIGENKDFFIKQIRPYMD